MDEIQENVTEREDKSSLARESLFPFGNKRQRLSRDYISKSRRSASCWRFIERLYVLCGPIGVFRRAECLAGSGKTSRRS
jgi:hypothetical protein